LVWPRAPEQARIEWLGEVRKPSDLGIRPGLFRRILHFFVGEEKLNLVRPHGVSVDAKGRLWITDPGARAVYVLDAQKNRWMRLPRQGQQPMLSPIAVAHDSRGTTYVSDSAQRNVRLFDAKGRSRGTWDAGGSLLRPTGLAYDAARELLWVVDTGKHQILALQADDEVVRTIGHRGTAPGAFNFPTHVGLDDAGSLYVSDTLNFRIQILSREGEPIRIFGQAGDGPGTFAKPKGLCRDRDGHIYVVDGMFDNVQIFDDAGRLLLAFGDHGTDRGELRLPAGLWIDTDDRIYVADAYNRRVQVFRYLRE
jgi:DNA-binding beta-propeller fold protein YncE